MLDLDALESFAAGKMGLIGSKLGRVGDLDVLGVDAVGTGVQRVAFPVLNRDRLEAGVCGGMPVSRNGGGRGVEDEAPDWRGSSWADRGPWLGLYGELYCLCSGCGISGLT